MWRNEHPYEGWAVYSDDPRQNPNTLGAPGIWHPLNENAQKYRLDCIAPVIANGTSAFDRADYVLRVLGLTV